MMKPDDASCLEALEDYPSFIKAYPGDLGQFANLADQFDFWVPERFGVPHIDYANGSRHFQTAVDLARSHGGTPDALRFITNSMRWRDIGPIERGFLDQFAGKASVAPVQPELGNVTLAMAEELANCCFSSAAFIVGEALANSDISVRCAPIISARMEDLIAGRLGDAGLGYHWTICKAAMAGCAQ